METTQPCTTFILRRSRPWLLVGSLLVGRNTEEAMILLVGDQLLGPKGALLVDLLLVESSPPRYFALLVGSRLVDVPLRETHGQTEEVLIVVVSPWLICLLCLSKIIQIIQIYLVFK